MPSPFNEGTLIRPALAVAGGTYGRVPYGLGTYGATWPAIDGVGIPWRFEFGQARNRPLFRRNGDTSPIPIQLIGGDGVTGLDISGATSVLFKLQHRADGTDETDIAVPADQIVDPIGGKLWLVPLSTTFDLAGGYWACWHIQFGASNELRIPNTGSNQVIVLHDQHP